MHALKFFCCTRAQSWDKNAIQSLGGSFFLLNHTNTPLKWLFFKHIHWYELWFNTLRPELNHRHIAVDISHIFIILLIFWESSGKNSELNILKFISRPPDHPRWDSGSPGRFIVRIWRSGDRTCAALLDYGRLVAIQLEIANKFYDFFINIGPSLTKNMPTTRNHNYEKYLTGNILSSFQFDLVDDDTIVKTLHSIKSKSSSGHDGISTKLLKFLSPPLISRLRVIINQSLITGIYPDKLKIAKVIPFFKRDDKAKTENYPPISPLSSISKIFEKIVYNQLYRYFTQNKLLYESIWF